VPPARPPSRDTELAGGADAAGDEVATEGDDAITPEVPAEV
jgi:hypothetical protein